MPVKLILPDKLTEVQQEKAQTLQRELSVEWLSDVLVPVLTQTSNVSIRILDWLVTNYSKSQKVVLYYRQGKKRRIFDVYHEYDDTLSTYGRKLFDPFRRGPRTHFTGKDPKTGKMAEYETTLAQIVFFKWADDKGVLAFCKKWEAIESDMHRAHHERNRRVAEGRQKKRRPLSKEPATKCFIFCEEALETFARD